MPVAVIQEWAGAGHDTTNYDEITRRIGPEDDPPAGLIVHTAGTTEDGRFRISDVWETREAWEAFRDELLMPAVEAVMSELPPDRRAASGPPAVQVYELHHVVRPEQGVAPR
jgi:hypothetical protein